MLLKRFDFKEGIIFLILLMVVVVPRFIRLDSFVQNDEPDWVRRAANFYYALGQREFEETLQDYHPAITTLWAGALSTWIQFPEHRIDGKYFEFYFDFEDYINQSGEDSLDLLVGGRAILLVGNSIFFVLLFYLLRKLVGLMHASLVTLILGFDPFHFGFTRLMAHEGMLSLALMVSIASFMVYYFNGRNLFLLLLSAFAAAVGMLSKSSGIIIVLFVGFVLFVEMLLNLISKQERWLVLLRMQIRDFGIWFGGVVAFYFVFCPGMWTAPGKMLNYVYGTAFSYASKGHRLEVSAEASSGASLFSNLAARSLSFWDDILWTLTPIVWMGVILGVGFIIYLLANKKFDIEVRTGGYFLLFGMFYFLMYALSKGRNPQHYILSVFTSLDVVSGLGIGWGVNYLAASRSRWIKKYAGWVLLALVVGGQIFSWSSVYPYYVNYCNPVMKWLDADGCRWKAGYGEGLDQAAAYLSAKPDAEDLTVLSWWGIGGVSYYFPGKVLLIGVIPTWTNEMADNLGRSDYLVVYYIWQNRMHQPKGLMEVLVDVEAEHAIWINGVEYVRIYDVELLPEETFFPEEP